MTKQRPPWEVMRGLADVPTESLTQRLVLLAAVAWTDADGRLWPSVETWASLAGLSPRGLQRVLRQLESLGLIVREVPSKGGTGKTSLYRVPVLARNPDPQSGIEPRQGHTQTPTRSARNPDTSGQKPRPTVGGTTENDSENGQQPEPVGDVFSRLGIHALRNHPHATPDRMAWIERDAPSKNSPSAWAASCIRRAWALPPPTPEQVCESKRAERQEWLRRFDESSPEQKQLVVSGVRRRWPSHVEHLDNDDPQFRNFIVKVMRDAAGDLESS